MNSEQRAEIRKLSPILRGMTESSVGDVATLYDRDHADGDPFVIRAADLLDELAALASPPAAAVQPVGLESAWQAFAAKLELNMEEPSARAKSHGVASRYVYAHTVALWEAFTAALANTPTQPVGVEVLRKAAQQLLLLCDTKLRGQAAHDVREVWRELCDAIPDNTPTQQAQGGAAHPDDAAVDEFAAAMKLKLARARAKGRGGWDNDEPGMQRRLSDMLRAHVEKGDPLDVANFCMFLSMRGEPIASAPPQQAQVAGDDEADRLATIMQIALDQLADPIAYMQRALREHAIHAGIRAAITGASHE